MKYFIHERKARAQPLSPEVAKQRPNRSLDRLPSYSDLFGNLDVHFDRTQSWETTDEKHSNIVSEVSPGELRATFVPEHATCVKILEEASGRNQLEGEYNNSSCRRRN